MRSQVHHSSSLVFAGSVDDEIITLAGVGIEVNMYYGRFYEERVGMDWASYVFTRSIG